MLEAAGYGSIEFGDKRSDKLLKIKLNLEDKDDCNKVYKHDHSLTNGIIRGQICASGVKFRDLQQDTCGGDSGNFFHRSQWKIFGDPLIYF